MKVNKNMNWISLSTSLPKKGELVGVYRPNAHDHGDEIVSEKIYVGEGRFEGYERNVVTHWMKII
tara:strand:- start:792 stop:986 length:195 start_codon:yes stop_codon:yes gene_type:complete